MHFVDTKPADTLCYPRLVVIVHPSFLLRVPGHVGHGLQVLRLGLQPLVDEQLRILGRGQKELPVDLQCVDGVHGLMYLGVQGLELLLGGRGQQEIVHLSLHHIISFWGISPNFIFSVWKICFRNWSQFTWGPAACGS